MAAYRHNVPVYIPAISDSSIGLNMLPLFFEDQVVSPSVILDVAESAEFYGKVRRLVDLS